MIIHALEGKPLPIYGDGSNVCDWLRVSDHCDALMSVIDRGRIGERNNVGDGNERSNGDGHFSTINSRVEGHADKSSI
jgi:dTDP-glucose 4,6-dehydratase